MIIGFECLEKTWRYSIYNMYSRVGNKKFRNNFTNKTSIVFPDLLWRILKIKN